MSSYSQFKKDELQWFNEFSPGLTAPHQTDPLTTKFQLMKALKAKTLQDLQNSVTLIWPVKESFAGKKVTYRYQRQDLMIEAPSQLEVFYPGLKSSLKTTGHFTRSGQSATFGLSLALKNTENDFAIRLLSPTAYFESLRVFDGLKIARYKEAQTALMDSSVLEKKPAQYLEGLVVKRLIVDTTNWYIGSQEIQEIINWAEKKKVELFLIRSHLKLDSLGAEYGLLGSVVRLAHDEGKEWDKFLLETLSYAGLLAVHEQIYPFLWDKKFLDLTEARTERIRQNTNYLIKELKPFLETLKHPMWLKTFDHGLFFGVFYKGQHDYHPEKFLKLAMLNQVSAKHCDSFGFDFLTLTNVISYYENSDESALRFCSGDNTESIADAAKLIKDYLSFFDQRT